MIGKDSRYASCLLYRDGDGDSIGTRQRIDTTPRHDDRFHTVTDGERLDLLAGRGTDARNDGRACSSPSRARFSVLTIPDTRSVNKRG